MKEAGRSADVDESDLKAQPFEPGGKLPRSGLVRPPGQADEDRIAGGADVSAVERPGAWMDAGKGKYSRRAARIEAISPRRDSAPGRMMTAPDAAQTAVSSTNVESGCVSSAGSWMTSRPQRRKVST